MNRERSRTKEILKKYESKNKVNDNYKRARQEVFEDKKGKKKLLEIKEQQTKKRIEKEEKEKEKINNFPQRLVVQFTSAEGHNLKGQVELSSVITKDELNQLINKLKISVNQEPNSHIIMADDYEITKTLKDTLLKSKHNISSEDVVKIVYHPENLYSVKPLTRGGDSLEAHTDSILTCMFSPCGKLLATGGGDKILRIWDMETFTLMHSIEGHTGWIMTAVWSACGRYIATGSYDGKIIFFDAWKGETVGVAIKSSDKWINSLSWRPLHLSDKFFIVSTGKDGTLNCYNAETQGTEFSIYAHDKSITKVIWSGEDVIYTCSQDMSVKSFTNKGILIKIYKGHSHWINTMAINTEFTLRTGFYDFGNNKSFEKEEKLSQKEKSEVALKRYNALKSKLNFKNLDRLVTGSDDYTMILWNPEESDKPVVRMTGHNQLINHVMFSPNTLFIASASFDKGIKLWNGLTGVFLHNFHGHVASVYQISWSSDSKFLLSASKDSTVKIWNIKSDKETKACRHNLPGHADEVYCIDWSPNGECAASGSKDQRVNIWRH